VPDTNPGPLGHAAGVVMPVNATAEDAFAGWADDPYVAWLDSGGPVGPRGRYSYIAVEPFHVIGGANPFGELGDWLGRFAGAGGRAPVPFGGGAVGFLGYETGAALERVPRHPAIDGMPDSCIGLYDLVFAFDRQEGRAWLISSGLPETSPALRARRAEARAQAALARLRTATRRQPAPVQLHWVEQTPRAVHEARVARTIRYIEAGDIYQANITAAFHAARPGGLSAADIHRALRARNPAPFTAYIGAGPGTAVASVSPERFIALDALGNIEARPIKGTRPRHPDPTMDSALQAELLASAKDRAENLMIVDLLRHDVSRVAAIGSVCVPELAVLESFASVHHLVSAVRGRLRAGATATDLLRAAFPGGSITGAPKCRAQEIIHELEPAARGPYCGAVVWMGWDGAMDSSIAIRTAAITPDWVTLQAGGGIVADSDPAEEYEELMVKIRPLLRALGEWRG
jgi:para-aminobenzoate synthetase component 1